MRRGVWILVAVVGLAATAHDEGAIAGGKFRRFAAFGCAGCGAPVATCATPWGCGGPVCSAPVCSVPVCAFPGRARPGCAVPFGCASACSMPGCFAPTCYGPGCFAPACATPFHPQTIGCATPFTCAGSCFAPQCAMPGCNGPAGCAMSSHAFPGCAQPGCAAPELWHGLNETCAAPHFVDPATTGALDGSFFHWSQGLDVGPSISSYHAPVPVVTAPIPGIPAAEDLAW